ncbi:hypothetical protein ACRYCC_10275 [Actinomadura scrupuli]|uniref:hypothetical protein n=1 Tax=Actinomadura scrupuli TaxID=559629 RepID=UPI003D974556
MRLVVAAFLGNFGEAALDAGAELAIDVGVSGGLVFLELVHQVVLPPSELGEGADDLCFPRVGT